jgi:hypothetical protein
LIHELESLGVFIENLAQIFPLASIEYQTAIVSVATVHVATEKLCVHMRATRLEFDSRVRQKGISSFGASEIGVSETSAGSMKISTRVASLRATSRQCLPHAVEAAVSSFAISSGVAVTTIVSCSGVEIVRTETCRHPSGSVCAPYSW